MRMPAWARAGMEVAVAVAVVPAVVGVVVARLSTVHSPSDLVPSTHVVVVVVVLVVVVL